MTAPLTNAPRLETENLILRGPERRDVEPFIEFWIDTERSSGFGTSDKRDEGWRWFNLCVGHWHWHGYGYFFLEDKLTGQTAGLSGIWNPDGWPEPELGWVVFAGFEGRSIAFEAATRARRWAYEDLGLTTLTSNIVPSNTRSKALATRLGAHMERVYHNEHMGEDELWRHPGPKEVL